MKLVKRQILFFFRLSFHYCSFGNETQGRNEIEPKNIRMEDMRQMSFDISSMYLSFICFMQSKRLDKLWLNGSLYRVIGFIAKTLSHITLLSSSGQKLI